MDLFATVAPFSLQLFISYLRILCIICRTPFIICCLQMFSPHGWLFPIALTLSNLETLETRLLTLSIQSLLQIMVSHTAWWRRWLKRGHLELRPTHGLTNDKCSGKLVGIAAATDSLWVVILHSEASVGISAYHNVVNLFSESSPHNSFYISLKKKVISAFHVRAWSQVSNTLMHFLQTL